MLLSQGWVIERWQIKNPVVLWITLLACLVSAWLPLFMGALQGKQNFFWLGWSMMLTGASRLAHRRRRRAGDRGICHRHDVGRD